MAAPSWLQLPARDVQGLVAERLVFDVTSTEGELYTKLVQNTSAYNNFFLSRSFAELLNRRAKYIYETLYSTNAYLLHRDYHEGNHVYNYRQAIADLTAVLPNLSDYDTDIIDIRFSTGRFAMIVYCRLDVIFHRQLAVMLDDIETRSLIRASSHEFDNLMWIIDNSEQIITAEELVRITTLFDKAGDNPADLANILTIDYPFTVLQELRDTTHWTELRDILDTHLQSRASLINIMIEDNLSAFKQWLVIYPLSDDDTVTRDGLFAESLTNAAPNIYRYLTTLGSYTLWDINNYTGLLEEGTVQAEEVLDIAATANYGLFEYDYDNLGESNFSICNLRRQDLTGFYNLPGDVTFSRFLIAYQGGNKILPTGRHWSTLLFNDWPGPVISAFEIVALILQEIYTNSRDDPLDNICFKVFDIRRFTEKRYRDYFLFVYRESKGHNATTTFCLDYFYFYCMRAIVLADVTIKPPVYPLSIYRLIHRTTVDNINLVHPLTATSLGRFIFLATNSNFKRYKINGDTFEHTGRKFECVYCAPNSEVIISDYVDIILCDMPSDVAEYILSLDEGIDDITRLDEIQSYVE